MRKTLFLLISLMVVFSMLFTACGNGNVEEPVDEPDMEEPMDEDEVDEPEEDIDADVPDEDEVDEPETVDEPVSEYNQAPMLDDMDLPPVEERISANPIVIEPVESIGEYGGTWNAVTWDPGAGNIKMHLYDPPIRWKADYTGYEPGLATDVEWSDDGRTITFHMREGVRWSDGEPFTTEDLQFWWEDLALNEDYRVVQVPWWARTSTGEPIEMEFPDDTTWVLHFDEPQYIMPYVLAQGFWEWEPLMKPKHFLTQWHPEYTDGAEYEELDLNDRFVETPGYPCLMAWCLEDYVAGESWTFARNPYYWKVDTAGNQLPYIDRLTVDLVTDTEVRKLQVAQGQYDCTFRGTDDPRDIPFLLEQADANDYRIVPGWMNGAGAWPGWIVNMDYHEDQDYDPDAESAKSAEIREMVRTQEFRKALSLALNRERLIDVVWEGIGNAKQFTISPQSPHFAPPEGQEVFEEWASADAEYDPERAAELFDEIGFTDQDGDGWRDLPSGEDFQLVIDLSDWGGEFIATESTEVYRQNLEELGVEVIINNVIGQPEAATRGNYGVGWVLRNTHASELDLWTYPDWVFPLRGGGEGSRAFPMQGLYYQTGGEEGWEPAEGSPAAQLQELYREGLTTSDPEARDEIIWDAVRVHIEEGPFVIGASGDQPMPVVCKNYFHNVPEYGVLGPWAPGSPGNTYPEQYWMEQ
jgi:peptide/nickel transport system substrate-binding protein